MIEPARLYDFLKSKDISFYTGVPDSLLKHFLGYIQDNAGAGEHVITANEGLAVALASGYHFSSGKLPLIYLQNSGLGNIINPITSLAGKEMYAVPMLLLIGWRGRPGIADEPQHTKMGSITRSLLEVLEIPAYTLGEDETASFEIISAAIAEATSNQKPVALLAQEDIFSSYTPHPRENSYQLRREDVISRLVEVMHGDEIVIATTGKIGREFYEQNKLAGNKIARHFLSVGAMGHANHIALGMHLDHNHKIVMLDGDGAVLMHMGALPAIAQNVHGQYLHIVLNNGSHESVGGQPTAAFDIDLVAIAKACGYRSACCISNQEELDKWVAGKLWTSGPQFVEIRINQLSRLQLGRPEGTPDQWKKAFMEALGKQ